MNWRRGLLRLWLALSVLWVVTVGTVSWSHFYQGGFGGNPFAQFPPDLPKPCPTGTQNWPGQLAYRECAADMNAAMTEYHRELRIWRLYVAQHVAYPLLPPAVVLLLGWVVSWVAKGFQGRPST